ncbi:MAG: formylmethanofuran dehydrogenase subunit E family protein [candidate division WOR-3 bacterium]
MPRVSLAAASRFHGHLGPWLVLGLRAGEHAARVLKASPFEIKATVWCGSRPPFSCFLDGVQLGSGCTLGKANIRHIPSSGSCRVTFRAPSGSLTLRLRPELAAELAAVSAEEADFFGRQLHRRPISGLFLISRRG